MRKPTMTVLRDCVTRTRVDLGADPDRGGGWFGRCCVGGLYVGGGRPAGRGTGRERLGAGIAVGVGRRYVVEAE
jgi:hypothetical protein